MNLLSRHALAKVAALGCVMCFVILDCEAQTLSARPSGERTMRERIAAIFRETLKRGESYVEQNGFKVVARTYVSPSNEHVDEIKRYGDDAIPILAEYLDSDTGFEKYLAMRFLGLIGTSGVVGPLTKVALGDASSSFRSVAVLWLTQTPWDLAAPIIRHVAENDPSLDVRERAKEILSQHVPDK